jgi:hypothetical protein
VKQETGNSRQATGNMIKTTIQAASSPPSQAPFAMTTDRNIQLISKNIGDNKMELLLQITPANTTSYMIAGYAVIFGIMLLYLISLIVRTQNLQAELVVLRELESEK